LILAPPSIPVPIAPAAEASGIGYTTAFTWTTGEQGGTDRLVVQCNNSVTYEILGGGRSVTLPDLSAHGVSLTPGVTTCNWSAHWLSYTMDELVKGPAAVRALPLVRRAEGDRRSFTF
jgi:hypothetical protein